MSSICRPRSAVDPFAALTFARITSWFSLILRIKLDTKWGVTEVILGITQSVQPSAGGGAKGSSSGIVGNSNMGDGPDAHTRGTRISCFAEMDGKSEKLR